MSIRPRYVSKLITFENEKVNKTIFLGKLHPVAVGVILAFLAVKGVHAEDNVEFNTDVLDIKERNNVDLSQFSRAGYLMPGKYQLTLKVNKTDIPDQTVEYFPPEDDPKGSEVCLTAEHVLQIGLKESIVKGVSWWHNGQCLNLHSLEGMVARADLGTSTLYLSIPQAYGVYGRKLGSAFSLG